MLEQITAALVLGISAGLHPGPLAALVVREAMNRGFAAGARVALAPVFTDGPIILIALLVLKPMQENSFWLTSLALLGAGYCLWLSWKTWRLAEAAPFAPRKNTASAAEAITVNLLNPSPYVFWLTVGGAYLTRGGYTHAAAFVVAFMVAIVGTKIAIAWLASRASAHSGLQNSPQTSPRISPWIGRLLSMALAIFAARLFIGVLSD